MQIKHVHVYGLSKNSIVGTICKEYFANGINTLISGELHIYVPRSQVRCLLDYEIAEAKKIFPNVSVVINYKECENIVSRVKFTFKPFTATPEEAKDAHQRAKQFAIPKK